MSEIFKASVQYNDWTGTSAADDADSQSWGDYLKDQELMTDEEIVVGIRAWFGENHPNNSIRNARVSFYLVPLNNWADHSSGPKVSVREVQMDISPTEFIKRFKRLEVALAWKSSELSGKELVIN